MKKTFTFILMVAILIFLTLMVVNKIENREAEIPFTKIEKTTPQEPEFINNPNAKM